MSCALAVRSCRMRASDARLFSVGRASTLSFVRSHPAPRNLPRGLRLAATGQRFVNLLALLCQALVSRASERRASRHDQTPGGSFSIRGAFEGLNGGGPVEHP